ncbi:hypothetical protein FNF27_02076 [Cafeteria roenbergensis]|uniref:WW domain-containing protein n=1 Tax=Cafeteria roenbergensis TaxID=33653 RepID=A0A5A8EKD5_CAFRO|nr:hypothetical protein FNF27_02076 [Cafeteria roenbergensis]
MASVGAMQSLSSSADSFRERLRKARSFSRSTLSAAANLSADAQQQQQQQQQQQPTEKKQDTGSHRQTRDGAEATPAVDSTPATAAGPHSDATPPASAPPPPPGTPPPPPKSFPGGPEGIGGKGVPSPEPATPPGVKLGPGETLLVHCPPTVMHTLSAIVGLVPGVFSAASFALNQAEFGPPMPWWGIALGAGASTAAMGVLWFVTSRHLSSVVLSPDGCHVRVTSASPFGLLRGSSAEIPVAYFAHKHRDSSSTTYLNIAPPGTAEANMRPLFMPVDSRTEIPDEAAFKQLLAGRAPISTASAPVDPAIAYWKEASAEDGRPYWFNEVTRQRQWEAPAHVAAWNAGKRR